MLGLLTKPTTPRPVSFSRGIDDDDIRALETLTLADVDALDELALADDVRTRLKRAVSDTGDDALVSVMINTRLQPTGPSVVCLDLGLSSRMYVSVFGPDGIDLHVADTSTANVLRSRDGQVHAPDLVEHEFAELRAARFLPYHGLGVTAVTGCWLKTSALGDGFRGYRDPERAFAVDPDVLSDPAVRRALNTRR